ncbi:MAG: cellobiose phosphorylase [Clostridia bacterium]|nr:cellobiose phosphorylase [Clostridia bacterium]
MPSLRYLNARGDFVLEDADRAPEMVFPLVNAAGMMSSITPRLAGDAKTGQNSWLLPPASVETLQESRAGRNFFLSLPGGELWSAAGNSAAQQQRRGSGEETAAVYGGLLWQETVRENTRLGVTARVLSFVPADARTVELMRVAVANTGDAPLTFTPAAAFPLYGRSADNIRDHRHVTSLLNRLTVTERGVSLHPTMTFDERGHRPGTHTYTIAAQGNGGEKPERMLGPVQDWVGALGWDWPEALLRGDEARWLRPGDQAEGYEMAAVLRFGTVTLQPGEEKRWYIALGIDDAGEDYLTPGAFDAALARTKDHWQQVGAAAFSTGDTALDGWLAWAAIQPELRRICGCSFLPHHDYGRGGRGWRDLWQDSLALLLRDPAPVREDLVRYFAGVRRDGTNATIIGSRPGEFVADRNNIVRVWMDHGYWPLVTLQEYVRQSGDLSLLLERQPWFIDRRKCRGEVLAEAGQEGAAPPESTVLEHLLVQNLTAFYDAGAHGCIRLRGADWNDALDMAAEKGESVAFTAAYAGNLHALADLCGALAEQGTRTLPVSAALAALLETDSTAWVSPERRNAARRAYEAVCETETATVAVGMAETAAILQRMACWLQDHLIEHEFVEDGAGHRWLNSYYDNNGEAVARGRMMLTGQVFALMSDTAAGRDAEEIIRAADALLYDEKRGGYCLNTDFGADIPPLGRQFGFAYGHKENGAVFCHMAVMYAYALYGQGYDGAAWKALSRPIRQSMDTGISRLYPGIPEYFDPRGRGMYPYLTGAGSWLMLCLITRTWGVRGRGGDLRLAPHLAEELFDGEGKTEIRCFFAGKPLRVVYRKTGPSAGGWKVKQAVLDGKAWGDLIPRQAILQARDATVYVDLEGDAQT